MQILKQRIAKLIFKFSISYTQNKYNKNSFHLNYEDRVYRQEELARIMKDSIVHFALTADEFKELKDTDDIGEMFRRAVSRISTARKDKKGDYGELLLFLLLVVFFPTKKFVTKVRLRTSNKDQVKGFDCAHFTIENGEACLWLGEAKFHESFPTAFSTAIQSIEDHCSSNFLKDEISILGSNIEYNQNYNELEKLKQVLSYGESLDNIRFKIPILLTYDSNCVKKHSTIDGEFKKHFQEEVTLLYSKIESRQIKVNNNFELIFLLFPFESVSKIKQILEEMEKGLR